MKTALRIALIVCLAFAASRATAEEPRPLTVFAVYATPVEEPWNAVLHAALRAAEAQKQVSYAWKDRVGTGAAVEKLLRQRLEKAPPDVVFGDAFGSDKEVRRVAADFP